MNAEEAILREHDIKPTAMRILLVRLLMAQEHPLSAQDMEDALVTADRSTISRTLTLFTEHRLVHTISDGSGSVKYEICHSHGSHTEHDDRHPHFHCTRCGSTFCLEASIPEISLPDGYKPESANFIITGLCPRCST